MAQTVSEIMSRDLVVLEEWENLLDVARDMDRNGLRHLPVVSDGRLVGLLSHRDLLRYTASALDRSPIRDQRDSDLQAATFVAAVMTKHVQTVSPTTTVRDAAEALVEARFGCLPVVEEDGTLVGMLSEYDLLSLLVSLLES